MQPSATRPTPRLLIVDDESFNTELLARVFRRNCDVDTASDGKTALEMLVQADYDVVLLDIMMPILNGLDVLKIIRNSSDITELPVILISAISDKADVARGIRLGANDYITKPIDVDTVQARVNTQVMLKQLVDERTQMIARLQSANEMRARMMQVASHDLKNPLNNLKMLITIMRNQAGDDKKLQKMLNMSEESIKAMLSVVDDFLGTQAISGTDIRVDLRPIDSYNIVRRVANQYGVMAHNKHITLKADDIQGTVIADDKRLVQVIGNLLSNAIKYSPMDSTVRLYSEHDDQLWRLYVQDQGPGIDEDEQAFLFQPFAKNKISTKPTAGEGSTGLGLWIVYEMMRLQDGHVGLDTPAEGGCRFWIELPIAPQTAHA